MDVLQKIWQLNHNSQIIGEIIDLYLDGANSTTDKLESAIKKGDLATIKSLLHRLKGSSMNVGARSVIDCIKSMEKRCAVSRNPLGPALGDDLSTLKKAISQSKLAFQKFHGSLSKA